MKVVKEYFELDAELWSDFSDVLSDTDGCILMDFEELAQLVPPVVEPTFRRHSTHPATPIVTANPAPNSPVT